MIARTRFLAGRVAVATLALLVAALSAGAQCAQWQTFEQAGLGAKLRSAGTITSSVVFDFDGAGPQPPRLVVAGRVTVAESVPTNGLLSWDGVAWRPVGGVDGVVRDVFALPSVTGTGADLYITVSGGTSNIYRWDGTAFVPQTPVPGAIVSITALATFDPDADGPMPRELYAAVYGAQGLMRLRDGAWTTVLVPQAGRNVTALAELEYETPTGIARRLVATGLFPNINGAAAGPILAFDGIVWASPASNTFVPVMFGTVEAYAVAAFDLDADGPRGPELLINISGGGLPGENPSGGTFRLRDGAWQGADLPSGRFQVVKSASPSNLRPTLVIFTVDTSPGAPLPNKRIALFDGQTTTIVPTPINGYLYTAAAFDLGGNGPQSSQIFIGGSIQRLGADLATGAAVATPAAVLRLGGDLIGFPGVVRQFRSGGVNEDDTSVLIAAGSFDFAGAVRVGSLAILENGVWRPFGPLTTGYVISSITFDPDGAGPQGARTFAYSQSSFDAPATLPSAGAELVNGAWVPAPYSGLSEYARTVAIAPTPTSLVGVVAGAPYSYSSGAQIDFGLVWLGGPALRTLPRPPSASYLVDLIAFDADGAGSLPPELVVSTNVGVFAFRPASPDPQTWTAASWTRLGPARVGYLLAVNPQTHRLWALLAVPGSITLAFSNLEWESLEDSGWRVQSDQFRAAPQVKGRAIWWDADGTGPIERDLVSAQVQNLKTQMPPAVPGIGRLRAGSTTPLGRTPPGGNSLARYRPEHGAPTEYLIVGTGEQVFGGSSNNDLVAYSYNCPCSAADIADDAGNPLPTSGNNSGVNDGDYNAFITAFFQRSATAGIADDQGTALPGSPGVPDSGVNEGDWNCFFNTFFNGCG
ncbi:hypothetical protein BH11PLA1_BH11PLA1_19970 [soil metagenome]